MDIAIKFLYDKEMIYSMVSGHRIVKVGQEANLIKMLTILGIHAII
jgi:hypothetical protein